MPKPSVTCAGCGADTYFPIYNTPGTGQVAALAYCRACYEAETARQQRWHEPRVIGQPQALRRR